MKNIKCKIAISTLGIGKFFSKMTFKKVIIILVVITAFLFAGVFFKNTCFNRFSKFVSDMVYDGAFHHYLYGEKDGHNGLCTVFATILGEILLTGLLFATINNYFRSIGERYLNGQYRNNWKNHTLFLGYDDMMVGTLKAACRSDANEVVIAVPNGVKELRDILKSILSDAELKCVELVQCRRDDINDLVDKACILTASKIYIIGQPDEPNHDSLNFKSLAEIISRCKIINKPHVITYLQNQSSFSMLKTKELVYDELKTLSSTYNREDCENELQFIKKIEEGIKEEIKGELSEGEVNDKGVDAEVEERYNERIKKVEDDKNKYKASERHINIIDDKYFHGNKNINYLIKSVKDNKELISYWIAARMMDWPKAVYVLGCEIERKKFLTKEELVVLYKEYNCRQNFLISNCEFFNFYSNTAFGLLTDDDKIKLDWHSEKKNLVECPNRQVHLVVMGMTEMGVAIVRAALRLAHPSGKNTRFKITMVDENAYEEMHYFIGRTKELFKYCKYEYHDYNDSSKYISHVPDDDFLDVEFDFVQCDVAHPLLIKKLQDWATDGKQLLSLVVCTKQSSKNMAVAMYLPRELREGDEAIPVWVYQESDDSMKHLLDDKHYKYIHPFSVGDHKVFTILRNETNSEKYSYSIKLALAYEEAYMGGKEEWTPEYADERWTKMSAMYRWSSIYNVFSMRIKLRAVGYDDIPVADIPDEKKTVIDETEHNRWNVEKLSDGFMPTSAEQHDKVMNELNKLLELYPQWYVNGIIDNDIKNKIEAERKEFAKYKKEFCHDNIRSNGDLEAYSKAKDRFLLNTYLKLIQKKELGQ